MSRQRITTGRVRVAGLALAAATVATPLAAPLAAPPHAQAQSQPHQHAQAALPSAESPGTVGIALADAPSAPRDDPRAHRYILGHLTAGETTTRRLEISNDTDSDQRIEIYAGPATVDGGRFLPTEPGAASALTRWIRVDTPEVRLPPRSSTEVTATISVPRDVPNREHYGVIWASHTSAAPSADGRGPGGVDLISRVGVRMYLSTGDERPPGSDFQIIDLRPIRDALGVAAVVATIANIGGRAVDVTGTVELTEGPGGLSAPAVPAEPATLAPGDTAEVLFRFAPGATLPPGEWRATLELASGAVRRESVQTITLEPAPAAPDGERPPADRGQVAQLLGGAVAALVAGALVLGGWRAVHRRRP